MASVSKDLSSLALSKNVKTSLIKGTSPARYISMSEGEGCALGLKLSLSLLQNVAPGVCWRGQGPCSQLSEQGSMTVTLGQIKGVPVITGCGHSPDVCFLLLFFLNLPVTL